MKKPFQIFNYSFVENKTDDSVDIHIDGDIVDASTQAMIKAFFGDETTTSYKSFRNSIDKTEAKVYNVIINSLGGHVGDAMAIHDMIIDLQNKGKIVNTIGRGIVASSATFILMAGKSPEMSANSWFMMHTVSGGVYGTVDQVENYAVTMRKFNNSARDLYAVKSGMRKEDVSKLMDAETWLTAAEAKEKGLVSKVGENQQFTNSILKENWMYEDETILNQYNDSVLPIINNNEDMKNFWTNLATEIKNALRGVKPIEASVDKPFDQIAFTNSVAEALTTSFSSMDAAMTTAINDAVTAQIGNAITAATKPLLDTITDLESDITTLKGSASKPGGESGVKPIGGFIKA